MTSSPRVASINGVPLNAAHERLTTEELRQRACTELLRQAAQREGLLAVSDAPTADGVISDTAAATIGALLALRQYLQLLAGNAAVEGVDLEAADTPLVQ